VPLEHLTRYGRETGSLGVLEPNQWTIFVPGLEIVEGQILWLQNKSSNDERINISERNETSNGAVGFNISTPSSEFFCP
jgi:hypothetical protein